MNREVENMVEGYFHAWGSTERLRAETGDRSAYPQPEMAVLGGRDEAARAFSARAFD